jgi:hypothetical protein
MPTPANSLNIQTLGFVTFDGIATFNGRTLLAGTGVTISNPNGVAGNPTISSTGTVPLQFTGNSGVAVPSANNLNVITANSSVKFVGSGSTLTQDFGISNIILGSPTSTVGIGQNVGIGQFALAGLTAGGNNNTALGFGAGNHITTGTGNVAIGVSALLALTTGINNIGIDALDSLTTGSNNTAIGIAGTSPSGIAYTGAESNNLLLSNVGVLGESNKIRIGTSGSGTGQQNQAFIAGITSVTAAGSPVAVSSTGQLSDLGFGTATNVLTSNGAGVSPTWQAAGGGGSSVYFSAYLSATQANVTGDNTNYPVPFNTAISNVGSGFNTGTGIFTAPSTGFYSFSYGVLYNNITTQTAFLTIFNGSVYNIRGNQDVVVSVGDLLEHNATIQIPMTAGDTMGINAFAGSTTKTVGIVGSATTTGAATISVFSGFKIA